MKHIYSIQRPFLGIPRLIGGRFRRIAAATGSSAHELANPVLRPSQIYWPSVVTVLTARDPDRREVFGAAFAAAGARDPV